MDANPLNDWIGRSGPLVFVTVRHEVLFRHSALTLQASADCEPA